MRHASIALCSEIAFYLLGLLSKDMPYWDLATMAFLVEVSLKASAASLSCLQLPALSWPQLPGMVPAPCAAAWAQPCAVPGSCPPAPLSAPCAFQILERLDWSEWHERVLDIMSKNLQSDCRERHRLALRGLVVLGKNISMVRRGQQLKPCCRRGVGERGHLG